jgi:tetratricopeptide (TPR) repeat protein
MTYFTRPASRLVAWQASRWSVVDQARHAAARRRSWTFLWWIRQVKCFEILCLSLIAVGRPLLADGPYVPASDETVLITLPQSLIANRDELATLRRQLSADPQNANLASTVAARYLQVGNREGDPRYYGYAQAAIEPWWQAPTAPPAIRGLRAKLKEKDHRYREALSDLQLLLQQKPDDSQAWIEVANLHRVLGQYDEARDVIERVRKLEQPLTLLLCEIPLRAVTGQAEEAYDAIGQTLPLAQQKFPGLLPWLRIMQAEVARALGRDAEAEQSFREAVAASPDDPALLRAYGDFLLTHNRDDEAVELLREHIADNGVLLIAAIAARRAGATDLASEWSSQLRRRFEEIRLRGGTPHGRFESRFVLEFEGDADRALGIAVANWRRQKEMSDARNVLQAAVASGNAKVAQPVLDFLEQHGTQDVELTRLASQLERE